ncbi:helix-turn-helix domain-containing protein [Peptacetobacter sp.]|uniref:helix-turn-helix domain-containing protein n=1 Tax=Peptacetobacter sp. TaxID=2991975 RepID=UPI002610B68A|nr:helix-turn-helix transcriptional regulator [Peptacetobacter sp.]
MESIGKRLKDYRKKAGLTQQQVADKANISRSHYASLESDKYNPSLETLTNIANVLNIDTTLLLDKNESALNNRDKKDIEKDLKKIMDDFRDGESGPVYFDGVELDEDDMDKLEIAMRTALEIAKVKNKEKYTPKKYKKDK